MKRRKKNHFHLKISFKNFEIKKIICKYFVKLKIVHGLVSDMSGIMHEYVIKKIS